MANRVLSIEIGFALTKVCEVDYKTKNSKVYQCFSVETPRGAVEDGYIQDVKGLSEIIKGELERRKIKTRQAVFSITSTKIANREVLIPFVKENKIYSLIQANANDYFPVDISGYQLAYHKLDVIESEGNRQHKLLVLAAPKDLLKSYFVLAKAAGLTVAALDYSGNSIASVVKNIGHDQITLVIRVDERSTLLTIFKEGKIVLQRNVPYGADIAVETMLELSAFGTDLTYQGAVNALRGKTCIRKSFDAEAMDESDLENDDKKYRQARVELTASLDLLIGAIVRVIDYFNSRNGEMQIERIYLTGLGGDFSGLSKLMTNEIGTKVVVLNHVDGVNLDKATRVDKVSLGEYLTCIGASIDPVDFIPEEYSKKKKRKTDQDSASSLDTKRIAVMILAGGLLIAVSLAVVSTVGYIGAFSKNKELRAREAQLAPIEEIYRTYTKTETLYKDISTMYGMTENANENLKSFMEELEVKMPSKIAVQSFVSDTQGVTMTVNMDSEEAVVNAIAQIRTFESLKNLTVTEIRLDSDDTGNEIWNFTVTAQYTTPAEQAAALEASASAQQSVDTTAADGQE